MHRLQIKTGVLKVDLDSPKTIEKQIEAGDEFQLRTFQNNLTNRHGGDFDCVGIWLESTKEDGGTIMFDMDVDDAIFFAKSLQNLAERIKEEAQYGHGKVIKPI